jgi:hypothetical protein
MSAVQKEVGRHPYARVWQDDRGVVRIKREGLEEPVGWVLAWDDGYLAYEIPGDHTWGEYGFLAHEAGTVYVAEAENLAPDAAGVFRGTLRNLVWWEGRRG